MFEHNQNIVQLKDLQELRSADVAVDGDGDTLVTLVFALRTDSQVQSPIQGVFLTDGVSPRLFEAGNYVMPAPEQQQQDTGEAGAQPAKRSKKQFVNNDAVVPVAGDNA